MRCFRRLTEQMAWLERRLGENSERIGRFDTAAQLTPEQAENNLVKNFGRRRDVDRQTQPLVLCPARKDD
jgi:hypothetical protein